MSTYTPQSARGALDSAPPQSTWLAQWLPGWQQMLNAVQLRFAYGTLETAQEWTPPIPPPMHAALLPADPVHDDLLPTQPQVEPGQENTGDFSSDEQSPDEQSPDQQHVEASTINNATNNAITQSAPENVPVASAPIVDVRALGVDVLDVSMRQGMGLVCISALIAGLAPFVWNWMQAASVGTALPLVEAAQAWAPQSATDPTGLGSIMAETVQIMAGLSPRGPSGLAAFLSALGEWLNWPLRSLAVWIVYGLGVLSMALLLGARTTLQHFYAATSYAAIPLLLSGLLFIPWVGWLLGLVGLIWAVVVYFHATRAITGLDTLQVVISMIAPVAVGALAMMLLALIVLNVAWGILL